MGRKLLIAAVLVCAVMAPALAYSQAPRADFTAEDTVRLVGERHGATTLTVTARGHGRVRVSDRRRAQRPQRSPGRARRQPTCDGRPDELRLRDGRARRGRAPARSPTPGTYTFACNFHDRADEGHRRVVAPPARRRRAPTPSPTARRPTAGRTHDARRDHRSPTQTQTTQVDHAQRVKLAATQKGTQRPRLGDRSRSRPAGSRSPSSSASAASAATLKNAAASGTTHVHRDARREGPQGAQAPAQPQAERHRRGPPRAATAHVQRDAARLTSTGCVLWSSCSPPASRWPPAARRRGPATEPRVQLKLELPDDGGTVRDGHGRDPRHGHARRRRGAGRRAGRGGRRRQLRRQRQARPGRQRDRHHRDRRPAAAPPPTPCGSSATCASRSRR